jgi:hypothetical protein
MAKKKPDLSEGPEDRSKPVSLDPLPFEEAVAGLLKVRKPDGEKKRKKADSRNREKRTI